jgi:hypothetical protein
MSFNGTSVEDDMHYLGNKKPSSRRVCFLGLEVNYFTEEPRLLPVGLWSLR